jgi:hypothetical protein
MKRDDLEPALVVLEREAVAERRHEQAGEVDVVARGVPAAPEDELVREGVELLGGRERVVGEDVHARVGDVVAGRAALVHEPQVVEGLLRLSAGEGGLGVRGEKKRHGVS